MDQYTRICRHRRDVGNSMINRNDAGLVVARSEVTGLKGCCPRLCNRHQAGYHENQGETESDGGSAALHGFPPRVCWSPLWLSSRGNRSATLEPREIGQLAQIVDARAMVVAICLVVEEAAE